MKNYDAMTDSEINSRIEEEWFEGWMQYPLFKPCSNPSHAWPIIVDNNISIVKRNHTEWLSTWSEYGCHMAINDIYAVDKNPLRAAMICYLKMKDDE